MLVVSLDCTPREKDGIAANASAKTGIMKKLSTTTATIHPAMSSISDAAQVNVNCPDFPTAVSASRVCRSIFVILRDFFLFLAIRTLSRSVCPGANRRMMSSVITLGCKSDKQNDSRRKQHKTQDIKCCHSSSFLKNLSSKSCGTP